MATDRELIDALCRTQHGWDGVDGGPDQKDYRKAQEIVSAHSDKVRGTFAPTTEIKYRSALEYLRDCNGTPEHLRRFVTNILAAP